MSKRLLLQKRMRGLWEVLNIMREDGKVLYSIFAHTMVRAGCSEDEAIFILFLLQMVGAFSLDEGSADPRTQYIRQGPRFQAVLENPEQEVFGVFQ